MVIRFEDIKEKGFFLETEKGLGDFPALDEMREAGTFDVLAPIQVRLRAIRVQDMVEVEGTVETRVRQFCSRCLKEFETPLSVPFAVTFVRRPADFTEGKVEEEEIQLNAEEMGLIPFAGETIDLRDVVQESVIMGMPLRPLCDEACRGLCPQCGQNLNAENCACVPSNAFSKLAALKDFKIDPKNEKQ